MSAILTNLFRGAKLRLKMQDAQPTSWNTPYLPPEILHAIIRHYMETLKEPIYDSDNQAAVFTYLKVATMLQSVSLAFRDGVDLALREVVGIVESRLCDRRSDYCWCTRVDDCLELRLCKTWYNAEVYNCCLSTKDRAPPISLYWDAFDEIRKARSERLLSSPAGVADLLE